MSIEILATANEWALRVSLVILFFLSFILYRRNRRGSFLLMFIGLATIISSVIVSVISWRFLLTKSISPQNWERLVIISNLSSILGYLISLMGCVVQVFGGEGVKPLKFK